MDNELMEEFEALSKPLVEFLNKNFHPHVIAVIAPDRADIFEGTIGIPIRDYLPK